MEVFQGWTDIPPELIELVYSFFDCKTACVLSTLCRRVRGLAFNLVEAFSPTPELWRQSLLESTILGPISWCPSLRHLDLSRIVAFNDSAAGLVASMAIAPRLVSLNLSRTSVTDVGLLALAPVTSNLTSLVLACLSLCTDVSIVPMIRSASASLQKLVLSATRMSAASVKEAASTCTGLVHLDISSTNTEETDESMMILGNHATVLTKLGELRCWGCQSAVAFQHMARNLVSLHLLVVRSSVITDISIETMATHLTRLTRLELFRCGGFTDNGLARLAKSPVTTLYIDRSQFQRTTAWGISLGGSTRLTSLRLLMAFSIADEFLVRLSRLSTNLRGLELVYIPSITDTGVRTLVEKCTDLTFLSISHCKKVSNACIEELEELCYSRL